MELNIFAYQKRYGKKSYVNKGMLVIQSRHHLSHLVKLSQCYLSYISSISFSLFGT